MHQDINPNRTTRDRESIREEIQQVWLSNELMKRVKEVAHNIDERVSQALQSTERSERT